MTNTLGNLLRTHKGYGYQNNQPPTNTNANEMRTHKGYGYQNNQPPTNTNANEMRTHKGYGYHGTYHKIYLVKAQQDKSCCTLPFFNLYRYISLAGFALLVCFALLAIKPVTLNAVQIYVVNSESRTLSSIDTETEQVQTAFAALGIIPNKFVMDENFIWCVNSGDNAVQKINRQTGATVDNILVEAGCNPWDACLGEGYLYVTGMFTDKVYKIDTATHAVVGYLSVGIAPEALCMYAGKLYVTNTGGYQNNYAGSSVSVIDLDSWQVTHTIPVSANPQYIIEKDGLLHVSCTGNWVNVSGAVCVIDPAQNEVIQTVNLGGSLGGIWLDNQHQGLVGDASGVNLYRYNTTDYSIINGAENPLTSGGSVVDGNDDFVAVLTPNWGNNGKVRLLHPDLSFWKEYTVGMAPTDMKLWQVPTPVEDNVVAVDLQVTAYPNPVKAGKQFTISITNPEAQKADKGVQPVTGIIKLYNLKGQLVYKQEFTSENTTISTRNLSQGCYLYKVETGQQNKTKSGLNKKTYTGKIIVMD